MRLGARRQHHVVADALQPLGQFPCRALRVLTIEIVSTIFAILSAVPDDVVSNDQNFVGHSDGGLLHSPTPCRAVKHSSEKAVLFPCDSPGILDQHAPQIAIPFSCPTGKPLAGAFRVARTQSCPTGGMRMIGELTHVRPKLCDESPRGRAVHTRNGAQPLHHIVIGLHGRADAGISSATLPSSHSNSLSSSASNQRKCSL